MGLTNFIHTKITEQRFKLKLALLGVQYPAGRNDLKMVNHSSVNKDARFNDSSAYHIIIKGFNATGLKYKDINLLDVGCGSGKVLTFAILQRCKSAIGIDLDFIGLKKAVTNCAEMFRHGYKTVHAIYCADACTYAIPKGTNVIFIANPFGKKTMEAFVENVIHYQNERQCIVYVIYAIPVYKEIFSAYPACTIISRFFSGDEKEPELVVFKIGKPKEVISNNVSIIKPFVFAEHLAGE